MNVNSREKRHSPLTTPVGNIDSPTPERAITKRINMLHSLRSVTFAFVVAISLLAIGCGDDTTGSNSGGNFRLQAEMTNSSISRTQSGKNSPMQGDTVNSLTVSTIRLMISDIKLQSKDSAGEEKVNTGAVILSVNSSGSQLTVTDTIPSGVYNKVAFKFHRFHDPEAAQYGSIPEFTDFVTPDRVTIIFTGTINGSTAFTYGSRVEEDLKLDIADFTVSADNMTVLALTLDVDKIFRDKDTGAILDPRDPENSNRIDNEVKAALNVLRK